MKNLLVILVILGIGAAYWYQLPEPAPPVAAATPTATPTPTAKRPPFNPPRSVLEDAPTQTGGKHAEANSVSLGSDRSPTPARH